LSEETPELDGIARVLDDDMDIESGRGGHSTANFVVPLAEVENGSNTKDVAQEDVDVIVVSAEPQLLCSNLGDGSSDQMSTSPQLYVSSSCRMGEHATQGKVDTPEPLACSDAGDAEDSLSLHQQYPRWLLLAHHVVSLHIARGPPGLEGELEGRVIATQWRPPGVKATSSLCRWDARHSAHAPSSLHAGS